MPIISLPYGSEDYPDHYSNLDFGPQYFYVGLNTDRDVMETFELDHKIRDGIDKYMCWNQIESAMDRDDAESLLRDRDDY